MLYHGSVAERAELRKEITKTTTCEEVIKTFFLLSEYISHPSNISRGNFKKHYVKI
jgi:hypothetical protein